MHRQCLVTANMAKETYIGNHDENMTPLPPHEDPTPETKLTRNLLLRPSFIRFLLVLVKLETYVLKKAIARLPETLCPLGGLACSLACFILIDPPFFNYFRIFPLKPVARGLMPRRILFSTQGQTKRKERAAPKNLMTIIPLIAGGRLRKKIYKNQQVGMNRMRAPNVALEIAAHRSPSVFARVLSSAL